MNFKFVTRFSIFILFIFSLLTQFASAEKITPGDAGYSFINQNKIPADIKGMIDVSGMPAGIGYEIEPGVRAEDIDLNNQMTPKELKLVKRDKIQSEGSAFYSEILQPGDYITFKVNAKQNSIETLAPVNNLSAAVDSAVKMSPNWLKLDLLLQFRNLSKVNKDIQFARLIINSPDNVRDEVAFQVAHMSVQTLTDARFSSDIQLLVRNAQLIYRIADSLKYVRLKEFKGGDAGDYYTTTEYRVANGRSKDTTWFTLPKEYYYWYIVHPKIYQEGVYAKDLASSTQQRTYGYFWREYFWFNPDSTHDYTKVNLKTSKGEVKTIPVLREVLKMPKVLWNKEKWYSNFNRSYSPDSTALDIIGNWASHSLPVDATGNRPVQPNMALYEHNGNCGEDAYVLGAAVRTALIPFLHRSTSCEDHAMGSFWDGDWNHYEFFRGGLSGPGNPSYGITNLMDGGSYEPSGWVISHMEGTRGDGYVYNHTNYYTETSLLKFKITDSLGNPLDGVKIRVYASPDGYKNYVPTYCGQDWTHHDGTANIEVGDGKIYYYQFVSPKGDTLPSGDRVYVLYGTQISAGLEFEINFVFPTLKKNMPAIAYEATPDTADYGIKLNVKTQEILTATNDGDSQGSRFYEWLNDNTADFFICDSTNYINFTKNQQFTAYHYIGAHNNQTIELGLPNDGTWYAVLSNKYKLRNLAYIDANVSIIKDIKLGVPEKTNNELTVNVYPNPFSNTCKIEAPEGSKVEVFDVFGQKAADVNGTSWNPGNSFPDGVYYIKVTNGNQVITKKVMYVR